jgi:hypothetical protein
MLIKLGIGKEQNRKSYQVPLWGGDPPRGYSPLIRVTFPAIAA